LAEQPPGTGARKRRIGSQPSMTLAQREKQLERELEYPRSKSYHGTEDEEWEYSEMPEVWKQVVDETEVRAIATVVMVRVREEGEGYEEVLLKLGHRDVAK